MKESQESLSGVFIDRAFTELKLYLFVDPDTFEIFDERSVAHLFLRALIIDPLQARDAPPCLPVDPIERSFNVMNQIADIFVLLCVVQTIFFMS